MLNIFARTGHVKCYFTGAAAFICVRTQDFGAFHISSLEVAINAIDTVWNSFSMVVYVK